MGTPLTSRSPSSTYTYLLKVEGGLSTTLRPVEDGSGVSSVLYLGTVSAAIDGDFAVSGVLSGDGAGLTNLNADNIAAGTLPIERGGTDATTATGALTNLLPDQSGNAGKVLQTDGDSVSWAIAGGTVTSVALILPTSVFSVSGSPVINSGTLTGVFNQQSGNHVFAGPTGVSPAEPSFRLLIADDLPNTVVYTDGSYADPSWITSLAVSKLTGTIAVNQGGTGQTTASGAFDALSPASVTGDLIYYNGSTNTRLSGNSVATRKFLIQSGNGTNAGAPFWDILTTGDLPSGISSPLTTKGDIYVFSSNNTRLPVGTSGQILMSDPDVAFGLRWVSPSETNTTAGGDESEIQYHRGGELDGADALLYNTASPHLKVLAQANTSVPVEIRAHSTQTADLLQLKKSNGNLVSAFDKTGYGFPLMATFLLAQGEPAVTGVNLTSELVVPYPGKITKAVARGKTAPQGASFIVDINLNGTSIWNTNQANRLRLADNDVDGEQTSFDTTAVVAGDILSIDVDQVGSTTEGQDITIQLTMLLGNQ